MNETVVNETSSLQLMAMSHPRWPSVTVSVFRDWESACRHLRDHVLTYPECCAWAIVCPEYVQILDPYDGKARFAYSKRAMESQGATAQELYNLYGRSICRNAEDARILKWVNSDGGITVALGTDGVLMVIDDVLRTAFLPGQGDPQATRESGQSPDGAGLPRERGMRSGRPGRRSRGEPERDRRQRERREANWTPAQRLYYRVFRPAVQFVRRAHRTFMTCRASPSDGTMHCLKTFYPVKANLPMSTGSNCATIVAGRHEYDGEPVRQS